MLKGFHVCIQVSDIDRSQHFYEQLGFSLVANLQHEDTEVIWRYLRHPPSEALLEVLQFKTPTKKTIPSGQRATLRGLNHIGFHVEDLDRIRAKLESLGAEPAEQGARAGYRYLFARGPDGEHLGFAEFGTQKTNDRGQNTGF